MQTINSVYVKNDNMENGIYQSNTGLPLFKSSFTKTLNDSIH